MGSFFSSLRKYVLRHLVPWISYFKSWFVPDDYLITDIHVFFTVKPGEDLDGNTIWHDNIDEGQFYVYSRDMDYIQMDLDNKPSFVEDVRIQTSFWYRNEKKTYEGTTTVWPPVECMDRTAKFSLPLKSATLITLNDAEDCTKRVVKFAGPFGDFYGKQPDPTVIFRRWEPAELQYYDYLEIVDILGFKKEIPI